MEKCLNHPGIEAHSTCRGCGKYFCRECLTEGDSYYYCINPDCRELLAGDSLPEEFQEYINCPECGEEIELEEGERKTGKFHCPECETYINLTTDPPEVYPPKKFIHLLSSFNNADIAIIKSILNGADIEYYFTGENFLLVDPLIQPAKLFVHDSNLEEAKELLKDMDIKFLGVSLTDREEE